MGGRIFWVYLCRVQAGMLGIVSHTQTSYEKQIYENWEDTELGHETWVQNLE